MFQIAVCDDEKIFVERISEIVKAFSRSKSWNVRWMSFIREKNL